MYESKIEYLSKLMKCRIRLPWLLSLALIATPFLAGGQVVLNEIMADNRTTVANGDDYPDYVELFNPSAGTVNLGGMRLTDNTNNLSKFVFPPNTLIGPSSYLIIWFDNNTNSPGMHSGFGLNLKGETLLFLAANGTTLDSVSFGLQLPDYSIGRVPNVTGSWVLNTPTPAMPNVAADLGNPAGLRINEWLATGSPDWIEVYNGTDAPVALGGLVLTDTIGAPQNRAIPALSFIEALGFVQFIANDLSREDADHLDFKLSSNGETLTLYGANRTTVIDRVTFGAQTADITQGRLPDGGDSIVFFPNRSTPGASNFLPITNVVISEVLAHTDLPLEDAIELHNVSAQPVDISHWWISNSRADPKRYRVPAGTVIPAGGFKVFYEGDFNASNPGTPFTLNSARGDEVFLSGATASGDLTGFRGNVKFGPTLNGVSVGRYQTSQGVVDFVPLSQRTFGRDNPLTVVEFRQGTGLPNAAPKVGPVVINEIMYNPPQVLVGTNLVDNTDEEFVELYNITGQPVPLFDPAYPTNTWRVRNGISFDFPPNVTLPAGGFLLLVNFNPVENPTKLNAFRTKYDVPASVPLYGPYGGKLDNGGETIELYRPDTPQLPPRPDAGLVPYALVEKVKYDDESPWPLAPDGSGQSLHRHSPSSYGNDVVNWFAASPTPGRIQIQDTDGDQMPDWWEILHGLDPNFSSDAFFDSDGDGLTNLQEFIAGTDPRNPESLFKVQSLTRTGDDVRVQVPAVLGRTYTLQHRASLTEGEWSTAAIANSEAEGPLTLTDMSVGAARFYRVRVTMP
jgi:hypothetical protein